MSEITAEERRLLDALSESGRGWSPKALNSVETQVAKTLLKRRLITYAPTTARYGITEAGRQALAEG